MKKLLAALGFAALLGSPVLADSGLGMTLDDFLRTYPEASPEVFNQIDTEGTGTLSQDELEAAVEAGLIEQIQPPRATDEG